MFPGGFALLSPDDIRVIPLSKQKLPQPGKMAFHGGAEQCVEDMHFLVPGATLLTLSLSLLELMTRVPTHHLPCSSAGGGHTAVNERLCGWASPSLLCLEMQLLLPELENVVTKP